MRKVLAVLGFLAVLGALALNARATVPSPVQSAFAKLAQTVAVQTGGTSRVISATCKTKRVETRVYLCQLRAINSKNTETCQNYYIAWTPGYAIQVWPFSWGCTSKRLALPPIPPIASFRKNSITGPAA